MQRMLYDREHRREDSYTFSVNSGGAAEVKEAGIVKIRFVNGKFRDAIFPFSGRYTRNGWRIMAAIEAEIIRIENGGISVLTVSDVDEILRNAG